MTYPSILDTHLHIIDRDVLTYPWLADAPALNHDFRLESYQAEAVRCGIGSALHMEADVVEDQIEAYGQVRMTRFGDLFTGDELKLKMDTGLG